MAGERRAKDGVIYERTADGRWQVVGYENAQPAGPPANPTFDLERPKVQTDIQATQTNTQGQVLDNQVTQATLPYTVKKAQGEGSTAGLPPGYMWNTDGSAAVPIPGYQGPLDASGGMSEAARGKLTNLTALEAQIKRVEDLFQKGPGSTSGIWSLEDYFPTGENQAFNSAAAGLGELGRAAFRIEGSGDQNAAELQQFIDANKPSASDNDAAIREKLRNLKERARITREALAQPNAMTQSRAIPQDNTGAAAFGAESTRVPIPPEMQAENLAWWSQNFNNLDPDAYAAFRTGLDQKYGLPANTEAYRSWATEAQKAMQSGTTINPLITGPEREMGDVEWLRNSAISNPVGAGIAGFTDSMSMGGVKALTGDQFAALEEDNPWSTLGGQMAGTMLGTSAIGKVGRGIVERAPFAAAKNILGGGAKAQFGRNLAADTAYSAGYGAVTEGDPITSGVEGAIGSVGGQFVGKALGKAVEGAAISPAAQALKERGIALTGGRVLGPMASRIEDKLASAPIIGDMIQRRQSDAFADFNRAAFDEAGAPIGFKPSAIGSEGVDQLGGAVSDAYTNTLAGVSTPFDAQFAADIDAAVAKGMALPADRRKDLGNILKARVQPMTDAGAMTGNSYQQAMRALKATRKNPPERFQGYEDDYRQAVTAGMDALTDQLKRAGGEDVVKGLDAANLANKQFKIIEDASLDRAKIGTQAGEAEVFVPSQLIAAARASEKKYGGSAMKELGLQGQEILPSTVPNSGTVDRLAVNAIGAGLLGGGAVGADYALDTEMSPYAAAVAALLAAGGTRGGQKFITAGLSSRNNAAKRVGRAISDRSRLFGSAGVPLVVGAGDRGP